jgi:hypothetical protein
MGTGSWWFLVGSLVLLSVASFGQANELPYKQGELLVRFIDTGVPQPGIAILRSGPVTSRAMKNAISKFSRLKNPISVIAVWKNSPTRRIISSHLFSEDLPPAR